MIKIFNGNRLTRQPFFQDLINYLAREETVSLRQIKRDFPQEKNVEGPLEAYVQAGYILRENRHYENAFKLLDRLDGIALTDHIFVDDQEPIYQDLLALTFETQLANKINQVLICERTSITRDQLTLSNYFFKLAQQQLLSKEQTALYELLGDVNPQYALKYITTFLLKCSRKAAVSQKRPDIFVEALLLLGYVKKNDEGKYTLNMDFDQASLTFTS